MGWMMQLNCRLLLMLATNLLLMVLLLLLLLLLLLQLQLQLHRWWGGCRCNWTEESMVWRRRVLLLLVERRASAVRRHVLHFWRTRGRGQRWGGRRRWRGEERRKTRVTIVARPYGIIPLLHGNEGWGRLRLAAGWWTGCVVVNSSSRRTRSHCRSADVALASRRCSTVDHFHRRRYDRRRRVGRRSGSAIRIHLLLLLLWRRRSVIVPGVAKIATIGAQHLLLLVTLHHRRWPTNGHRRDGWPAIATAATAAADATALGCSHRRRVSESSLNIARRHAHERNGWSK